MKIKLAKKAKVFLIFCLIIIAGMIIPENFSMPVEKAGKSDYNPDSFWYYPWGKSISHKGVDIFANKGTNIYSATNGLVIYSGEIIRGGNVLLVLGPKWRLHYYAHLDELFVSNFAFVSNSVKIGSFGTSGNAVGKSPHIYYSILTLIPYLLRIDSDRQGWKKMFYLNPIKFLNSVEN